MWKQFDAATKIVEKVNALTPGSARVVIVDSVVPRNSKKKKKKKKHS
jgi:hypothetical protein